MAAVTYPSAQMTNAALLLEIKSEDDLLPPGAPPGSVPTDLEQATGLERLEILGKMQGVDIFDMKPLDASRKGMPSARTLPDAHPVRAATRAVYVLKHTNHSMLVGTLDDPIIVRSFGDEQYAGCTGYPVDSHVTIWLTVRPREYS